MKAFVKFAVKVAICATAMMVGQAAVAQDTVMFNYQGRVKVMGDDFSGDGLFKFAILSPDGGTTLWSNDSTSEDGSEPTTGMTIPVEGGVFNVLMGVSGEMDPINSTIFQSRRPLKLRTWFSDQVNGFQQLRPDHNLINVNLITSQTGRDDFIVYVDGASGDDSNSGLKPNQAKKTIQAAVDIVPPRVMANVTIDIADGTYPEEVLLYGISCKPGKKLRIQGDTEWTPADGGAPGVIVTGLLNSGLRETGLRAQQCTGIEVTGICFEENSIAGVLVENGQYSVSNCVARKGRESGFSFSNQVQGEGINLVADDIEAFGIAVVVSSRCHMTSPTITNSNKYGLFVSDNSACLLLGTAEISDNTETGIHCIGFSTVGFAVEYANGQINRNGQYAIQAGWNSYFHNRAGKNTMVGNGLGIGNVFNGGQLDY